MKAIFIIAVSLVILAETGDLRVATEKLEAFRKRLQEKYAAKEQQLAEELAQKVNEQKNQPVEVPITIGDTTLEDLVVSSEHPAKRPYVDAD